MYFVRRNCATGSSFAGCGKIGTLLVLLVFLGCGDRQLGESTPQMNAAERFWVRVLILDDVSECTVAASSTLSVLNGDLGVEEGHFEAPDTRVKISISGGVISVAGHVVRGDEVILSASDPHIFILNGDSYRGKLKLVVNADGQSFDAINVVPLEPYLAGVVGAEMPYYWEPAALEAQAIAARTYCLYIKRRFGKGRSWDVKRTAAHQVYLGVAGEAAQVWDAVDQTNGQVLVCTHGGGDEDIFPAYYSSTCGGHTEDSKNVFGDSFEPLAGRACPYCRPVTKPSFFFWPSVEYDKASVSARLLSRYPQLRALGRITGINVTNKSSYEGFSRMTMMKLTGSSGKSDFLRAEDLRLTIDPSGNRLRSTNCQIRSAGDKWMFLLGRGYGHGVGMCQYGAQGMAREGKSGEEILLYYYPGAGIVRVY